MPPPPLAPGSGANTISVVTTKNSMNTRSRTISQIIPTLFGIRASNPVRGEEANAATLGRAAYAGIGAPTAAAGTRDSGEGATGSCDSDTSHGAGALRATASRKGALYLGGSGVTIRGGQTPRRGAITWRIGSGTCSEAYPSLRAFASGVFSVRQKYSSMPSAYTSLRTSVCPKPNCSGGA